MEKEIVLITGANGTLARRLSYVLEKKYELRFLSRKPVCANQFLWDIDKSYVDAEAFVGVKHIVHLAGTSVAEGRWSQKQKLNIRHSRVQSAALLLRALKEQRIKIQTFISASAVGYYGTQTTKRIYAEGDTCGSDFLSEVCVEWEQAAAGFEAVSQRVIVMRLGTIFSGEGGALPQMSKPIALGLGAALGTGKQYVAWIDVDDACRFVKFAIEKPLQGTFNLVASSHLTNAELTQKIANQLQKKLWLPNVPAFVMKMLFGEMSVLLLEGSRISNEKVKQAGFVFQYESVEASLQKELSERKLEKEAL